MRKTLTRSRLLIIPFVVLLAILAGGVANAAAYESRASPPQASFQLRGSHGYRIEVTGYPGFSSLRVTGKASKGGFGASTDYSLFGGRVTADRVYLPLGHRGKIDVRFEPSGKARRHHMSKFCKGRPEMTRFGVFTGTIRFRGEGDYTSVSTRRVRGAVQISPRQVCHFPHVPTHHLHPHRHRHPSRPRPLVTTFAANDQEDSVAFVAVRTDRDPTSSLLVAINAEVSEGLFISREAMVVAPSRAFAFDPSLNSATIAPPAPFAGSATFQRIDDFASRWEGPLTVSFPGKPEAPLTGRAFSWSLSSKRERSVGFSLGVGGSFSGGFFRDGRLDRAARAWLAGRRR